jgi:hypothetical protein
LHALTRDARLTKKGLRRGALSPVFASWDKEIAPDRVPVSGKGRPMRRMVIAGVFDTTH